MFKVLPKTVSGISQNFYMFSSSVFPLCLHYAPSLEIFLTTILEHLISECFIRLFYHKVTSIREYRSKELCTMQVSDLLQFALLY